jgi:hypothetical protein
MLDNNNLRILQVNLNKSAHATESALQTAVDLAIDLLVVQEPWLVPPQHMLFEGEGIVKVDA